MRCLIVGAGAVGRGLLGYRLLKAGHNITFLDSNLGLIDQLKERLYYPSLTEYGGDIVLRGPCGLALIAPNMDAFDAIFVSVRVQNFEQVGHLLKNQLADRKNTNNLPIIVCENTPNAAEKLRRVAGVYSNVFYRSAIAECIIPEIKSIDPLLTYVDPNGYLIIDSSGWQGDRIKAEGIQYSDNFQFDWDLKWHCHCALHAVVGLLGRKAGICSVHDTVRNKEIRPKVARFISAVRESLWIKYPGMLSQIDARFERELWQLSDSTRPDTCERVTRDLQRKMERGERLMDTFELIGKNEMLEEAIEYARSII